MFRPQSCRSRPGSTGRVARPHPPRLRRMVPAPSVPVLFRDWTTKPALGRRHASRSTTGDEVARRVRTTTRRDPGRRDRLPPVDIDAPRPPGDQRRCRACAVAPTRQTAAMTLGSPQTLLRPTAWGRARHRECCRQRAGRGRRCGSHSSSPSASCSCWRFAGGDVQPSTWGRRPAAPTLGAARQPS